MPETASPPDGAPNPWRKPPALNEFWFQEAVREWHSGCHGNGKEKGKRFARKRERCRAVFMRTLLVTLLVLIPFESAAGRPHPIRWATQHKIFVVTTGALFAAQAADVQTSLAIQQSCRTCVETNPFVGRHPSAGELWSVAAAESFAGAIINWRLLKSESKVQKSVALSVTSAAILLHSRAAYENSTLTTVPRQTLSATSAHPLATF